MTANKNISIKFNLVFGNRYHIYEPSVILCDGSYFFLAKDNNKKYLFVLSSRKIQDEFDGIIIGKIKINGDDLSVKRTVLSYNNLKILRNVFPHLNPRFCGLKPSFGTGDRLGIVTPAHLKAFENGKIFPFLCQQSVRELNKTGHSWQQVISNAIWGIFEYGYKGPFGADADHVKKIGDLKSAIETGFTMFTIDPSDHVPRGLGSVSRKRMNEIYDSVPERKKLEKLYLGKRIRLNKEILMFDEASLPVIAASYFKAIGHVSECYEFIRQNMGSDFDFEVSMDETENPTTPLAHFFIASELRRNGIDFQNLALRFSGEWQKALDYIGSLDDFMKDIKTHTEIARKLEGYKLSLHSGSEKFSVYKIFYKQTGGIYHIKTSGTSWLESLRVAAMKDPELFKEMYKYAAERFDADKKSYGISADASTIPAIEIMQEKRYGSLLDMPESRQMMHVTFGSILNAEKNNGYIFRDRLYKTLFRHEKLLYKYVSENIKKHLELLTEY